jgi:sugar/nucleoside kinase (ribokinase family)
MAPVARPVLLLAPLSRDEILGAGSRSVTHAGGAGLYASWALSKLGARVILHTPLAGKDRDLLRFLPAGVDVVVHPSRETTSFRIELDPGDLNKRILVLLASSDPLDPALLGDLSDSAYVFLGPLLPGDIDGALAAVLRKMAPAIDLGVQGLVRRADRSGLVSPAITAARLDLPPLRVLAGDEREVSLMAGGTGEEEALRILSEETAMEVVLTRGDRGASIRSRGASRSIEVPAVATRGRGAHPVGLGDTFLAVYGWHRHTGATVVEAGARAALAATELLEAGLPVYRSR